MSDAAWLTEDERYAAGLASLGAGPRRLRRFLDGFAPPEAWEALERGCHPADPQSRYRDQVRRDLLDKAAAACERSRTSVNVLGRARYPAGLAQDHEAPAVLFAVGDPMICDSFPRVSVVGTRSATPYGLGVASEFGSGLAEAGVVVVSGLARGIDAAAHTGALAIRGAPVLGVLGTAPDAPRPRWQATLLGDIARRGTVVSELPPGSSGAPAWWFVVRNRVMAAFSHVVVVVECHARGGALHTVKAATERSVAVTAVTGSVRSAASIGTNGLLVDGASPVRDVDDVIAVLELAIAGQSGISRPRRPPASCKSRPTGRRNRAPNPIAATVLRALDHDPAPLDTVVRRCGLSLGEVALALEQLAGSSLAASEGGWWSRPRR